MIEIAGATPGSAAGHAPATNSATNGATKDRLRAPDLAAGAPLADVGPLQRSCLAVLRAGWTTLAVVATDPSAPGHAFAAALAELARSHRLRPVRVLDGAVASSAEIAALQDALSARGGEVRTVIALDDPHRTPAAAPLLAHAEAVVLVVRLGASDLAAVEETVELVGRERVLGAVVAR